MHQLSYGTYGTGLKEDVRMDAVTAYHFLFVVLYSFSIVSHSDWSTEKLEWVQR